MSCVAGPKFHVEFEGLLEVVEKRGCVSTPPVTAVPATRAQQTRNFLSYIDTFVAHCR